MPINPYALFPLVGGLIAAFLAVYSFIRRSQTGARYFLILMTGIAVYNLGYTAELTSTQLEQIHFWIVVEYSGLILIPIGWLLLGLNFTRRQHWIKPWLITLLVAVALVVFLGVLTNPWLHLHYSQTYLDTDGPYPIFAFTPGPLYYFNAAYVMVINLFGAILVLITLHTASGVYRRQLLILLAGAIVPFLVFVLYISGMTQGLHLDINPIGFLLSGLIFAWGVFGYQLLDLAPLARERIIDDLSDGVIVLDSRYCLVDINPMAKYIFGWEKSPLAKNASELFAAHPVVLEKLANLAGEAVELQIDYHHNPRTYELTASVLTDTLGNLTGVILLFHDVTERNRIQASESRQRAFADALRATAAALNSTLDTDQVLDRIIENVDRVVPNETVDIFLVEGDKARLVRRHSSLHPNIDIPQVCLPISQTPNLRQMSLTRQAMLIPDVLHDPDWVPAPDDEWIRSVACAPIFRGDHLLGFIHVLHSVPSYYNLSHTHALAAFADQAAIALANAYLYQESQQSKEVAEQAVALLNAEVEERQRAEQELLVAKEAAEYANQRLLEALASLEQLATTDKLTGIYNRHKFDEVIGGEIARSLRAKRSFVLLMFDMDHLKAINDRFGHSVGDHVLQELIRLIKTNLRAGDGIFRWGGDEFIVLAPEIELQDGVQLGEKLRRIVAEHTFENGIKTSISVGVAAFRPTDTIDSLLIRVDDAMYNSKRAGRNCVSFVPAEG